MKKQIASILTLAVLGLTASVSMGRVLQTGAPEPAAIIAPLNYTGTTVGGPTYNRLNVNSAGASTGLSAVGTAVAYDVVNFTIATTGTYAFLSTSLVPANWDNFTSLYSGIFNPAAPASNFIIGNDDFPTIGKSGFSAVLTAGSTYSFVTTGYSNTSSGSFADSITLTSVPEPGTWAMIGASMVGLAGAQRFRRRSA